MPATSKAYYAVASLNNTAVGKVTVRHCVVACSPHGNCSKTSCTANVSMFEITSTM
jgi:hypothetical protein